MSKHRGDISVTTPIVYSICVSGTPETDLFDYVRGMTMTSDTEAGEPPVTILRGQCADQSALVGLLSTLANFHVPIICMECRGAPAAETDEQT